MRSTPYFARLCLLVLTLGAVLALTGCGATPTATPREAAAEPCGETGTADDYACVDGRRPRDHVARGCVLYSSVYSIDLWRCEPASR
jgi:hypothetical protein